MTEPVVEQPTSRIALISAVPGAIPPAVAAIQDSLPGAVVWNILDDRLLADATEQGGVTESLSARMRRLIDHAVTEGADGVLLTCSLYSSVAASVDQPVPVLGPDQAAFDEIARAGYRSVLLVASIPSARDDSTARLEAALAEADVATQVVGVVAEGAVAAVAANDTAALVEALDAACRPHLEEIEAVFLAQYTLAPPAGALSERIGKPVLSGPTSSAERLRSTVGARP